jgi:hypothetical protein
MNPRSLVGAALVAGLLTACGGSSGGAPEAPSSSASSTATTLTAAQYKQALEGVSQQADESQGLVQKILHAKTVGQVRTGLAAYARDHQALSDAVSQLHPPADAAAANQQLAKAFADTGDAIRSVLSKVAEAKSAKAALRLIQHAKAPQQAGQELDAALTKLKALGYTPGS